jgi:hypothetical protein
MKHHNRTIQPWLLLMALSPRIPVMDGWDDHYTQKLSGKSTLSQFDFIASKDDFNHVAALAGQTGITTHC